MFGLKKSKVKGDENGYTIFDIPNEDNHKIAVHKDGDYVTIVGRDKDNDAWYRLGDRMDLIPAKLNDSGLTCFRGSDVAKQKEFVEKYLKLFAQ